MSTPHIDIDECVQRYIAAFDEIAYVAEQLEAHMGIATHYDIAKDYLNALIEDAHLAPKMKRVNLDDMKYNLPEEDFPSSTEMAYDRAIDDIKSKYGDLYVEVK